MSWTLKLITVFKLTVIPPQIPPEEQVPWKMLGKMTLCNFGLDPRCA